MPKKLTRIEVIDRANEVHGYKYIYDKMEYVNASTKSCIICPIHGEFWQSPCKHLIGRGCPKCAKEIVKKKNSKPFSQFLEEARKIHNDKYAYDESTYYGTSKKMKITCPVHGEFWQTPNHHLQGCGCPECAGNVQMTNSDFIKKAKEIHGDKYIYTKTNYINIKKKVCITCPKHGDFYQTPEIHLRGCGCPECYGTPLKIKETFIQQAKKVHGDKYIYDEVEYVNNHTFVKIICKIHGPFWQLPYNHLHGQGCPKCIGKNKSTEEYIQEAKKVHGDKYVYVKTDYNGCKSKVCITCPEHGDFWQVAGSHLQGHGCPKCSATISKGEKEVYGFIKKSLCLDCKLEDRNFLEGLESDVIIPSHKLIIEFDGLYWHSEKQGKDRNYHLHKTELAESKGYHLIHIFEDEWMEHKDIVLNKIRHFLGKDLNNSVIGARKCTVKTVSKTLAEPFLTTYHIQGFVGSTAYYGAYFGDKLVGVMTFKQEEPNMWNLTRFATNTDYRLPGLANKIFKQFVKDNNPIEVKTFLDRRWVHCNENVYDRMGFKLVETLAPDYRYVVKGQRLHKFGFRKQILSKKYNLPLTMTEREMTEQLGFYRIWDCGLYKYVWKNINNC